MVRESNLYILLLVFILLIPSILSKQIVFFLFLITLSLLILAQNGKFVLSHDIAKIINPFLIFNLLIISAFILYYLSGSEVKIYDFFKDIFQFSYPILLLLIGYFISSKIKFDTFARFLVYFSLIMSIIYFLYIIFYLGGNISLISSDELEKTSAFPFNGFFQAFSFFLISSNKVVVNFKRIFQIIFIVAIILTFSRTAIVLLILSFIFSYGLINSLISITLILTFIFSTFSVYNSDSKFLQKISAIPTELFLNYGNEFSSKSERNQNWRSFEAQKAISQVTENNSIIPSFVGFGAGSLVDLGYYQNLNGNTFRYINKLHNGFAEIFFKSGIFGILIVIYIFFKFFSIAKNNSRKQLLYFLTLSLIITTFVIGGIINKGEISNFILFYSIILNSPN